MNKYKQLTKKIAKTAIIAAIIVAGVGAIYFGISLYSDSVNKQRKEYEAKLNTDDALLANLNGQMAKSGEAEKRYISIQESRSNYDFSAELDGEGGLKNFLTAAKTRYVFSENPKPTLKSVKPKLSDKPELSNLNYDIFLLPRMEFKFNAASDMHVFSFIDDLRRAAPGLIHIDKVELKRSGDMTPGIISQAQTGPMPTLVDATIEFTWIRIVPKDKKDVKAGASSPSPVP